MAKKKKTPFVNLRFKAPRQIHDKIVLHQKKLNDNAEYEVSLEEAALDMWKASIQVLPHLK